MITLIEVDGSHSSLQAIRYGIAAATGASESGIVLLHVSPSGRTRDLERGRFLLEDGLKTCQFVAKYITIRTRLEVGDPCEKLPAVAEAEEADLVVIGSHGYDCFPHVADLGTHTARLIRQLGRPVVVVAPDGREVKLALDAPAPSSEAAYDFPVRPDR
ncbi:MAG: universal stress protein [Armatimonadetes bacterium]|nr:universal stress protein [Armatimonadota bacterium]